MSPVTRRLPVYLLLDTSGSMMGEPIEAVRVGVKLLKEDLQSDPAALEVAYLSVITFDSVATQVIPLTEIAAFTEPVIQAHGTTAFGQALTLLESCYESEIIKYASETEKGDYKPLVFLMTDGRPTDDWEKITDDIGSLVRGGHKFNYIVALGMGHDVDISVLKRLTDNVMLMQDMKPEAFKDFFKYVSQSIKSGSKKPDDLDGKAPSGPRSGPVFVP